MGAAKLGTSAIGAAMLAPPPTALDERLQLDASASSAEKHPGTTVQWKRFDVEGYQQSSQAARTKGPAVFDAVALKLLTRTAAVGYNLSPAKAGFRWPTPPGKRLGDRDCFL